MQITTGGVTYDIQTEPALIAWLLATERTLPKVLAMLPQVKRA